MAQTNTKAIKRFGPRYGRTLKLKFAKIEAEQRKKHKCPYCNKEKVKRQNVGIFKCLSCGAEFTGRAYTPAKTTKSTQQLSEKDLALQYAAKQEELEAQREQEKQELAEVQDG